VIDRAEDWDGDAVPAARNRPADGERGDASSADSPAGDDRAADDRAADDRAADAGRSDAVLTTPEQRVAAQRRYQDTVDRTYDVARIEAEPDAGSQDSRDPRPQDASEEGATRDAGAEPDADDAAREAEAPNAKDTGARDAWALAVPGLRAEWEKHEREFPERSRSAPGPQADGGWLGDGDRRLTPEQNTDASKACEDIRTEGREVILPAMERVEAADPDRRLAGLEHMLKGEDRLKEKIADEMTAKPELTVSRAVDRVVDSVRFTFTYSAQRYAEGTLSDVERLKAEGFELTKLKNLWTDDQYKGINSQWRRSETGLRFEVQFHTPESLEAKELTHGAYERIRSPASREERREMKAFQRQVNALLVTPPGTDDIKDFPEKR
jgi:hypothetical protein